MSSSSAARTCRRRKGESAARMSRAVWRARPDWMPSMMSSAWVQVAQPSSRLPCSTPPQTMARPPHRRRNTATMRRLRPALDAGRRPAPHHLRPPRPRTRHRPHPMCRICHEAQHHLLDHSPRWAPNTPAVRDCGPGRPPPSGPQLTTRPCGFIRSWTPPSPSSHQDPLRRTSAPDLAGFARERPAVVPACPAARMDKGRCRQQWRRPAPVHCGAAG